jgi:ribokinase
MMEMPTKVKICVVGSANVDLLCKLPRLPKMGETLMGTSFHMGCGGKGSNQAAMAAKLGADVSMVTKLGRDALGEMTFRNYQNFGIDTSHVYWDETHFTGVAPIFVDETGRNMIVIVPGANMALTPTEVREARDVICAADVVLCQLEIPVECTLEAFRIARDADVRTILNPAPASRLPQELLQLCDIVAPNETEAEILTGMTVATLKEAQAAGSVLLARGPHAVVITLGERGALLLDGKDVAHVPAVKVRAVDTTGAGDAFIGSLAVFLGEGSQLRQAVERSNAVAALSVMKVGAQVSFPTREEVECLIAERS